MWSVAAEGVRAARSARVPTLVLTLTAAAACATSIATVGRTVEQENEILATFDTTEARIISFSPGGSAPPIDERALGRLRGVNSVEWAIGLSGAFDVTPAAVMGAEPYGARYLVGNTPDITLSGEDAGAYVNAAHLRRLGLSAPAGAFHDRAGRSYPIEGTFRSAGVLDDVAEFILVRPAPDATPDLVRLTVAARQTESVPTVVDAGLDAIGITPGQMEVAQSERLAEVRSAVSGTVGRFGRTLVVLVLSITSALGSLTIFAAVSARRHDFGRRRALGASRGDVVTLVVVSALTAVLPGSVLGVGVGVVVLRSTLGGWPEPSFPIAVGVLVAVTMGVGALAPALGAAQQDPSGCFVRREQKI